MKQSEYNEYLRRKALESELEAVKKERDEALIVLDGLNRAIGADSTGRIEAYSKQAFRITASMEGK